MDYSYWLSIIAVVLLNNLVLYFWRPWAGAYAGEKGKNLARKEDLDKILTEIRAVTMTQREIESQISGKAWTRQMHWNQRCELYAGLVETINEMSDLMSDILAHQRLADYNAACSAVEKAEVARGRLTRLWATAQIFASPECREGLATYIRRIAAPSNAGEVPKWVSENRDALAQLLIDTIAAAKSDLGIETVTSVAN